MLFESTRSALDDDSYLKRRCEDALFSRDSAQPRMGPLPPKKRRTSGKSETGDVKRKRQSMETGTDEYNQHKWGVDVEFNRRKGNLKSNSKRTR